MKTEQELFRSFTIHNQLGMHARPAALLVQTASQYQADIKIIRDEEEIDCKSILNVMILAAAQGATLKFVARGEDAENALNAIESLFEDKFGEA